MIRLDISRSLAPQGPAYGVRQLSDVSGLGAGTEALRGQELRRDLWLSIQRRRRCLRRSCGNGRLALGSVARPAAWHGASVVARGVRRVARGDVGLAVDDGDVVRTVWWAASFADAVLALLGGNVPEISRAATPTSVLPRGGCVCPCQPGLLVSRCRAQRGNGQARKARADFSSPPSWARGGLPDQPPLCPPGAVFRRSFVWTTGCREIGRPSRPSTGGIS